MKDVGSRKEELRMMDIMIMLMIMKMSPIEKHLDLLNRIKRVSTMNLKKSTVKEKRKMMHTFTDNVVVSDTR
ncbi:hypothetical protein BCJMU51_4883 [Bacillus cereus]|nr:hypothetical protein BCM0045_4864 [Bacillus cereus]BCC02805.1 hypothetical protein BCM0057_4887 [Bacillus cereus]BCC26318.1 hypothetical protein BCM0079_4911 [Bacillus cereus]BCC37885.1 hypothetical protein BCM0105_4875 [Bacillus cereus]BCC43684.1 hypothetical protein BCJMU01_4851 [Bacillus cereus]